MFTSLFSKKSARPSRRPRSFVPSLESLEARAVPTVNATIVDPGFFTGGLRILKLDGDSSGNHATITHDGNGHITLSGDFSVNGPVSGKVDKIEGHFGDGGNRVFFFQGTADSPVTQKRDLTLDFDLGGGKNRFGADLHGQIGDKGQPGRNLTISVHGGGNKDTLEVDAGKVPSADLAKGTIENSPDVFNILANSTLNLKLDGGGGNDDVIKVRYNGKLDGALLLDLNADHLVSFLANTTAHSKGEVRGQGIFGEEAAHLQGHTVEFLVQRQGTSNTTHLRVEADAGFHFGDDGRVGTFRGVLETDDVKASHFDQINGEHIHPN